MNADGWMEESWLVENACGLHARPAAMLARVARQYEAEIQLICGRQVAEDARSIVAILSLAATPGSLLTARVRGAEAESAIRAMADLFACQFHECEDESSAGAGSPRRYRTTLSLIPCTSLLLPA